MKPTKEPIEGDIEPERRFSKKMKWTKNFTPPTDKIVKLSTKEPRKKRRKLIDYVIRGNNYKVTLREARMLDNAFRDGIEDGYKECAENTIKLLNNGIGSLLGSLIQTRKS